MKKTVLRIGTCRQPNTYVCGPASLKIVFDFFGKKIPIKKIITVARSTFEAGTPPKNLIRTARTFGFRVLQKFHASLHDIEQFIMKDLPVVVVYQAWGDGHYSVIHGFDKTHFYISDPAIDRGYRTIRKDRFLKQWHDKDVHGKPFHRWLMVLRKNKNPNRRKRRGIPNK